MNSEATQAQLPERKPLLSVGIPVYNEGHYIGKTLDSLLGQDFQDFELIVSDNASQDETESICREYAVRDPRIKYHRSATNQGAINNFNLALELSRGKYFTWAGGHDLRSPNCFSRCIEVLEHDTTTVLCYPRIAHLNEKGDVVEVRPEFDTRAHRADDPVGRVMYFIWSMCPPDIIYGVVRSDALRLIGPSKPVPGCDYVQLINLGLIGRFAQVQDQYLYTGNNRGAESSDARMDRYREYFFSDNERPSRWFPIWAFVRECLVAVLHAKLAKKQKIALSVGLLMWLGRLRAGLRGDLRRMITDRKRNTIDNPIPASQA